MILIRLPINKFLFVTYVTEPDTITGLHCSVAADLTIANCLAEISVDMVLTLSLVHAMGKFVKANDCTCFGDEAVTRSGHDGNSWKEPLGHADCTVNDNGWSATERTDYSCSPKALSKSWESKNTISSVSSGQAVCDMPGVQVKAERDHDRCHDKPATSCVIGHDASRKTQEDPCVNTHPVDGISYRYLLHVYTENLQVAAHDPVANTEDLDSIHKPKLDCLSQAEAITIKLDGKIAKK